MNPSSFWLTWALKDVHFNVIVPDQMSHHRLVRRCGGELEVYSFSDHLFIPYFQRLHSLLFGKCGMRFGQEEFSPAYFVFQTLGDLYSL